MMGRREEPKAIRKESVASAPDPLSESPWKQKVKPPGMERRSHKTKDLP